LNPKQEMGRRGPVREALAEIVRGTSVKRSVHELVHDGRDLAEDFVAELALQGYVPVRVSEITVQPGERAPAFYIDGKIAYFGWVFWEQFTSWKIRKLWGSVVKDARGDWKIQLPDRGRAVIYANASLTIEMDIDHPPEF
jgi:hypothetical protein